MIAATSMRRFRIIAKPRIALFARTKAGFKSRSGKILFCASGLLGFGLLSPVLAESLRADQESESCALIPLEKRESKMKTCNASTGELLLRFLSLLCIWMPLVVVSPLLLLNHDEVNRWIYRLLRKSLSSGGPLFIKWGQWASTRYDLLPLSLCNELNFLTQNAPQHCWEHTDQLLREEFKGDYTRSLKMDKVAIASGSIAQTYRGMLGNKHVAVKVQHPGVARIMEKDIILINHMCNGIDNLLKLHTGDIFRQFAIHLHDQLDFRQEKRNLERFQKNFKFWRFVCFPKPYTASERVLVETFEPGHSVIEYIRAKQDNAASAAEFVSPEMRRKVGSLGLAAVLKMIMTDNFVHADLHPGNVLVRPVPKPTNIFSMIKQRIETVSLGFNIMDDMPQVCILDAGLISTVKPALKPHFEKFFKSLLAYDGGNVAQAILDLSKDQGQDNSEEAKLSFIEQMRANSPKWRDCAWSLDQRSGECMKDALNLVRQNGIRLDASVMVPLITAITLEGWQYELDPTVSVLDYVQRQANRQDFFLHLSTRMAHSLWKSAEVNVGIDEESPPSWQLAEEWSKLKQKPSTLVEIGME